VASFIPAAKTVRIAMSWTDEDGHIAVSRFFLSYSGSEGVTAEYTAIAAACEGSVITNLTPLQHSSWSTDEVVATDLSTDTSPQGIASNVEAGGLGGGRLPASTAALVSMETGRRYRGGHSRVYLPLGDDTKLLTDAEWTTAFVAAFQAAFITVGEDTATAFAGHFGTITQVMASFYSGFTNVPYGTPTKYRRVPTGRATAALFPVVNLVGKQVLGTQRRRLRP
jgi:hypothetical protein